MSRSLIHPAMEITANVVLTDLAAEKVKEFLTRDGHEANLLRVSLVRTHCMGGRGYSYSLAPGPSPTDDDAIHEANGVAVVVRRDDVDRLGGTVIDYAEGLEGSGFTVQNPHTAGKCPCGHHDLFE